MEILVDFFSNYGYIAVFSVLIICGFGIPIPEDITLVAGGIISGLGLANPHLMLVISLAGVLLGDSCMFMLGRVFGIKIIRFRLIRRGLTVNRVHYVREKFTKHGNKFLFVARFLPGLRAPIYMIAGITGRVNLVRFILIDFFAAIISVPIWIYLGYYGASNKDWLTEQLQRGKMWTIVLIGALILFVLIVFLKKKLKAKLD